MASYTGNSIAGGDGNVFNDDKGSWATVKALTSGTAQPTTDPTNIYASKITSDSIGRIFLPFDTSTIPAGSRIISATLQFNITTLFNNALTPHIVQSSQASSTNLVNSDFGNVSFVDGGSVFVNGTGLFTITLNTTALGWINAGGVTKLAMIEDHDLTNTDPGNFDCRAAVSMSENATVGNRPLLTVTYNPPGTSPSSSLSPSASLSPSSSISASISPSASLSPSASRSPSASLSPSASSSPSQSPSASLSPSASRSPSASLSPSISPSASQSPSASISASISPSSSASPSLSPSSSSSSSVSPSPSVGYADYTRGDYLALPVSTNDLETQYSDLEESFVATRDNISVGQTASGQYMVHQFKSFVGANTSCSIEWEGKSDLAPEDSTVFLQIFNHITNVWDTKDVNSHAEENQNFELEAKIDDITNYKDSSNVITCRVYQLAT